MQNFKSFLLKEEQTEYNSNIIFQVSFYSTNLLNNREFEFLKNKVIQSTKQYKLSIILDKEVIEIQVDMDNEEVSEHNINNIYEILLEEVNAILLDFNNDIEGGDNIIILKGIPNKKVSYYNIDLYCKPNTKLTGIEKVIEDCEQLTIYNSENVIGNVLSLLRLKKVFTLEIVNSQKVKWVEIVEKYFKEDDKDILSCQEELIANGLRQYAKF